MDLKLFKEVYSTYKKSNVSEETWKEYYETLFVEISKIKPEQLKKQHLIFMKRSEEYFSSIEHFEKADILCRLQEAANNIFQARETIKMIKSKYNEKN